MKVMAVFKPVTDEETKEIKDNLKNIKKRTKDGLESFGSIFKELNGLMNRINEMVQRGGGEDPNNSTIVILPQYISSFNNLTYSNASSQL